MSRTRIIYDDHLNVFLSLLPSLHSGVKLYKGETLLELTERWRFIYKRLYDPDEDRFDLSRIPDVHDNVRFDVLHNPHLGLTSTLEKLYSLAKSMADTVVPQEYGTTLAEKRSVGIKICSPLLEKIKYDLLIARTDNKADMRYMINMDYSADLPINTMGRRIRTRLYLTSESHLHTMLNVLRFAMMDPAAASCSSPILSGDGMQFLNDTKEVCYLTQIVIRLFEDTSQCMDNPKRFRVEILFSAGATATPLHMSESTRENDTTRLDTDPLFAVGRDGLTCTEVEEFFDSIISEGGKKEESDDSQPVKEKKDTKSKGGEDGDKQKKDVSNEEEDTEKKVDTEASASKGVASTPEDCEETNAVDEAPKYSNRKEVPRSIPSVGSEDTIQASNGKKGQEKVVDACVDSNTNENETNSNSKERRLEVASNEKKDGSSPSNNGMSHKTLYLTVGLGTLLLGAGCLVMALSLSGGRNNRRRYTTRR